MPYGLPVTVATVGRFAGAAHVHRAQMPWVRLSCDSGALGG